jgi:hypothetical protein
MQPNNPIDPRDPLSAAFYYTFIDKAESGRTRGGRGGNYRLVPNASGVGWFIVAAAFMFGLIIAILTR